MGGCGNLHIHQNYVHPLSLGGRISLDEKTASVNNNLILKMHCENRIVTAG